MSVFIHVHIHVLYVMIPSLIASIFICPCKNIQCYYWEIPQPLAFAYPARLPPNTFILQKPQSPHSNLCFSVFSFLNDARSEAHACFTTQLHTEGKHAQPLNKD